MLFVDKDSRTTAHPLYREVFPMQPIQANITADPSQKLVAALSEVPVEQRRSCVWSIAERVLCGDGEAIVIGGYSNLPQLSPRQMQALQLLNYKPTCRVQEEMGISYKTMESHKSAINRAFDTKNYRYALRRAREMGLLPYPEEIEDR